MYAPVFGIYLHIPFCRKRCAYCDYVSNAIDGPVPEAFITALRQEIRACAYAPEACSIFFGGGTPSMLSGAALESLLDVLHARFALSTPEITLEANPDDVTCAKAKQWRALGVNRVSLGVQSFDDDALRFLGRRHDAAGARRAAAIVADLFENWSMDLIYGVPQTSAWRATLRSALEFAPPHLSTYCLSYEPGTPLAALAAHAYDDDALLALYRQAEETLGAYAHYEISNFARPGRACRHNLLYWRNEEYAGFGPGAFSYLQGRRMRNTPRYPLYLSCPGQKAEDVNIDRREQQVETLIQHMRLREGVEDAYFRLRFGVSFMDTFGEAIAALTQRGLLRHEQGRLWPTNEGFYLNNEIGLALLSR